MSQSSPRAERRKISSPSFTAPAGRASTASEVATTCSRDQVSGGCQSGGECCVSADITFSPRFECPSPNFASCCGALSSGLWNQQGGIGSVVILEFHVLEPL